MRDTSGIGDQILPHFNPEIGDAIALPVPVHRRVEEFSRIGQLVTDDNACCFQCRDRYEGGAIIPIVEDADFPWPNLFRLGCELRRKAVERYQQPRLVRQDRPRELLMIGSPEAVDPRQPLFMGDRVARKRVSVAGNRDDVWRIFFAVEIDDQPRDAAQYGRNADPPVQRRSKFGNPHVERDMSVQQASRDAQIDFGRHVVGGMICNQQQAPCPIACHAPPRLAHNLLLPTFIRNVTKGSAWRESHMFEIDRRQTIAALALTTAAPALAKPKKLPPPTVGPLETISEKLLARFPESAVYNGTPGALDGGPLARTLDDYSPGGEAATRAELLASRELLARIRVAADSDLAKHLPLVSAILENATRSAGIAYGKINPFNFSGHVPYVVSQLTGPHVDGVNWMMEQQSLASVGAVDAWIAKLDGFGTSMPGVVAKIRADAAMGCKPPRALLEKTLPILDSLLEGKAAHQPMIKAFESRIEAAGLSVKTRQTATRRAVIALQKRARPALAKLRLELLGMLPEARSEAGVWALPDGEAFYAANVRTLGDTSLSPVEIHKIGLDEVTRISAEMNLLLANRGMTQGSIGARMLALARDPANQFPDSDAGREELLAFVRDKVKGAEARYAELLPPALVPRQSLLVKRVPVATQASAPGGYYDGPSLDGTRPGTYWINLRDMAAVAKLRLPTLSYHEGVPGHHTQGSIAAALGEVPILIKIASFNAYAEGWALYSERLMAELGAYANDPLGDLGRLQDELFRAVRLVVDTGLHHKRWTREAAIAWMLDATGVAQSRVTAEIERYMAWPGQALGYKLGQIRLLGLRERMKAKTGKRFDVRDFHAGVLGGGAMPIDLVEARLGLG